MNVKSRQIQTRDALLAVAQSCTLPYRRFVICNALDDLRARERANALPNAIRRYSRLKICATASGSFHQRISGDSL